ncbi:MAG: TlpA disulfide reductase family protein [Rhodocyclaceae bacterium]
MRAPWHRARLVLVGALAVVALAACKEAQLEIGQAAPPLAVQDSAGQPASLDAWRGQPVYVNFWSAGCGSCLGELRALDQLGRTYAGRVAVVTVNIDREAPDLVDMQRRNGFAFTMLQDQLGISLERYRVIGTPTSVIIGRDGRAQARYVGGQTPQQMTEAFALAARGG